MGKIEVFKDDRAKLYDAFVPDWIPHYASFQAIIAKYIQAQFQGKTPQILVAGCGTGNETKLISEALPEASITAVDPSPEMIELAKAKLVGKSHVKLLEGTVDMLPVEARFDLATLVLVLHFMPDDGNKLALLQDLAQRLRPGAPFILVDIFGAGDELLENLQVLKATLPAGIPPEDIEARIERIRDEIHHISEKRLLSLLEAAGFTSTVRFYQTSIYGGWITRKA